MKLKFEGIKELQQALEEKGKLEVVNTAVKYHGAELQRKIMQNADFKKGYQTGTTKRSVMLEITDGGLTAISGPTTGYAPYVEWGTRYMEAQPFVKPAFDEQSVRFISDMQKLTR